MGKPNNDIDKVLRAVDNLTKVAREIRDNIGRLADATEYANDVVFGMYNQAPPPPPEPTEGMVQAFKGVKLKTRAELQRESTE